MIKIFSWFPSVKTSILELRQNKNDSIGKNIFFALKLPRFSTHCTGVYKRQQF